VILVEIVDNVEMVRSFATTPSEERLCVILDTLEEVRELARMVEPLG